VTKNGSKISKGKTFLSVSIFGYADGEAKTALRRN
jgi:hypothetical protein